MNRISLNLCLSLLIFSSVNKIFGQIAIDSQSQILIPAATQTVSFSHTCSATCRLLLVSVVSRQGGPNLYTGSAKLNGLPMTMVWMVGANGQSQYVWRAKNPPAGTDTISITLPFSPNNILANAVSFNGVDTVNTFGAQTGNSGINDTCTSQISTAYNNSVLVFFVGKAACADSGAIIFGPGQIPVIEHDSVAGPEAAVSILPAPVPGNYSVYEAGHCVLGHIFGCLIELKEDSLLASVNNKNFIQSNFELFPNPATNSLFVRNRFSREMNYISVHDVSGKIMMNDSFYGEEKNLDISKLQSGVYFVRLNSGNKIVTRKFIKM